MQGQDWFWPEGWPVQPPSFPSHDYDPHQGFHPDVDAPSDNSHSREVPDERAEFRQFCEKNDLIRNNPNNDSGKKTSQSKYNLVMPHKHFFLSYQKHLPPPVILNASPGWAMEWNGRIFW